MAQWVKDLALPQLWIKSLTQELPCAAGATKQTNKKKPLQEKKPLSFEGKAFRMAPHFPSAMLEESRGMLSNYL